MPAQQRAATTPNPTEAHRRWRGKRSEPVRPERWSCREAGAREHVEPIGWGKSARLRCMSFLQTGWKREADPDSDERGKRQQGGNDEQRVARLVASIQQKNQCDQERPDRRADLVERSQSKGLFRSGLIVVEPPFALTVVP
jgi:hypothetical protein